MQLQYLDGGVFLEALRETTEQLRLNREKLNQINVFPVPDGDTGNNLLHTIESALQEAQQALGDNHNLGSVVEAASRGAQNGSCGSSGAIFAQFLKGWALMLSHLDQAGVDSLARALKEGAKKAYAAVVRPVEGTILTVARKAAEAAAQMALSGGDMAETLLAAYRQGLAALNQTPRMLDALGRRGVVDAGGWGLLLFFSSLLKAMHVPVNRGELKFDPVVAAVSKADEFGFGHAYDMEFILTGLSAGGEKKARERLYRYGSELITRNGSGRCHVHIHTDRPLAVVERAASLGTVGELSIRDMRTQFQNMKAQGRRGENLAAIALGQSPGFMALFALAGAEAVASVDAPHRISLLLDEYSESNVIILSSGNGISPQSFPTTVYLGEEARVLSALLAMQSTPEPSEEAIRRAAAYPRTANITVDGQRYRVNNGKIEMASAKLKEAFERAVASLEPEKGEMLSLFYGCRVKRGLIEKIAVPLRRQYPELEIEILFGGQDFPLVLSIE